MGRKIKIILLFIFLSNTIYSQSKIFGKIIDENKKQIPNVSIVIKNKKTNTIKSYTYSNESGSYLFENIPHGVYILTFSSMAYKEKKIEIELKKESTIQKNIILEEGITILNEVFIKSKKPITINNDIIIINVQSFIKGNEQVVEDLLRNLPGIEIDDSGLIKVEGKEVEKVMIEGDDFFERGYRIITKNMPSQPIKEVEILKNYSNNRLLKGIEESDKIALNLVLKEDAKRIWFGNTEIGYGNNNFYHLKANLMNFGKKTKIYFLTNLNNTGNDITGDIDFLIRPFRFNEPASIGDNQQVNSLLNLSPSTLNFKKNRTNFNNAELVSLNAIFNPTKKLKIKTLGFFNWDETNFFRNATNIVNTNGVNFTNTEDYKLRNKKRISFGKIDVTYNISKTKMIESITKFNDSDTNDNSNLLFNGASTIENLQSNNTLFDQKISYTNKLKDKKVFLLTARYINEKTPQNYSINQFFYQDLFPNFTNTNNVQQQSQNQMQFAGFEVHLLDRKDNGSLLELQFGNEYRKDKLTTTFTLFEDSIILDAPEDFQNNTIYQTNDLYFKSKYRHKIKDVAIIGKLNIHQLFNTLKFSGISQEQNPFFINPNLGLSWKINKKNKITSSYSYNTTNAKILDVYDNFVLTGFRSFSKGTSSFNQLNASSLVFNYQLGNWSDRFFANTFVLYNKNFDFFSNNTLINQNFTQSERIVIKDREFLSISSKFDYYFKKISSNLKLDLGYSKSNYKNIINNSDLRKVRSNNYSYGFELNSGFNEIFNYHIGTKWTTNEIEASSIKNAFTDNVSFLDLSFVFNEKFNVQFQTERYFFGSLNKNDNTYYFLDFDARYTVKKNKLSFALTGKNLFNTDRFRNFSISDIGTSTTEYRLLERFVLLKIEYRF